MCAGLLSPFTFLLTSLLEAGTCPTPEDVLARTRLILRLAEEQRLSESFLVERREGGLQVELRRADGAVIGERLLPGAGSCDELAQAAAVTLSAWLSDVHPDFAGELPSAPPVVVEPPGATQLAPAPVTPPRVVPLPVAPLPVAPSRPLADSRPPRTALQRLRWELDGGIGAGFTDGGWAPGGSVALGLFSSRGWGSRLGVFVDANRRAPLDPGSVSWRRWPLWWGPSWRFGLDSLALDVSSGPALSWLRVVGVDFEQPRARSGVTWAWTLDARLGTRGRWGWFIGWSGYVYLGAPSAFVGESEYRLPRFALSTLVGGRFAP